MILVVSRGEDEHAGAVGAELDRLGVPWQLLDLGDYPRRMALSLELGPGATSSATVAGADGRHELTAAEAVWWRRPQPFGLHPELSDPGYREFALRESAEAWYGAWYMLGDRRWMNRPAAEEVAGRKVFQLHMAAAAGLATPRTLVTSDAEAAAAFVAALAPGEVVYKAFSGSERHWRETRLVRAEELAGVEAVRYAPVIFQEYVPGVDLRVTVVGNAVFAAAIDSRASEYPYDFRMDMDNAEVCAAALPDGVAAALLRLMRRLGLEYGAVDLRRDPDGRHVFLEVNPSGQWLFVEGRTGQPITAAVAAWLTGAPAPGEGRRAPAAAGAARVP